MSGFKVQMLTTPGVRKDQHDDQELGEDATGFVVKDDYVVLWVADGAPGTKIDFKGLNFGSRVLAKYMGECFETVALKSYIPKTPFNDVFLEEFTTELRKQLATRLATVHTQLAQVKDKVNLDDALEIKMNGTRKTYSLTWGATFVGALVDMKNNVCYTMSIGDCIALSDGTVTLRYEPPPEPPASIIVPEPVIDTTPKLPFINLDKDIIDARNRLVDPDAPVDPNLPADTAREIDPHTNIIKNTKWLFPPIRPKAVVKIKHTTKERLLTVNLHILKYVNDASINIDASMHKYYKSTMKKFTVYGVATMKQMDKFTEWMGNASTKAIDATMKFIGDSARGCNKVMNTAIDKAIDAAVYVAYYKKIKLQKEAARLLAEANRLKEEEAARKAKIIKDAEDAKLAEEAAQAKADSMVEELMTEQKLKIITGRANRMFVFWSTNTDLDSFEITNSVNNPCFGEIEDVKSLILMSDGVIPYNEIECKFGFKDPENVWNELKSTNNVTDDDKTAIYFKILGNN